MNHGAPREKLEAKADDDAPETPAHLFPVRAFKHALFGTPAPPKTDHKPSRAKIGRPTSREKADFPSSPMKQGGILRTPGTGGQKRKSVSFGGHGETEYTADDTSQPPGNYPPSPWVESEENALEGQPKQSVFAKKLRQPQTLAQPPVQEDLTLDMTAPRSTSGKYWKDEFESYSANTERQLKKLAKKEQVAKKLAQMKMSESQQLEEDLKYEQNRAVELERKVLEFRKQLESQLQDAGALESSGPTNAELERLRKENELLRAQLKAQSIQPMELPTSNPKLRDQSPERPIISRATTEPSTASLSAAQSPPLRRRMQRRDTVADIIHVEEDRPSLHESKHQPASPKKAFDSLDAGIPESTVSQKQRPQSPRKHVQTQPKDSSDIWTHAASPSKIPGITTAIATKPASTPLRHSKTREPLSQRNENPDSRSSSTAGALGTTQVTKLVKEEREAGSRSSSTAGTLGSREVSNESSKGNTGSTNIDMPAERQAAARKRLEERKRRRLAGST